MSPSSYPRLSHGRIGAAVVSPSTVAPSDVRSRPRRAQQRVGMTGDQQVLVGGAHPHCAMGEVVLSWINITPLLESRSKTKVINEAATSPD